MLITYDSNNSGGRWWLKDEDWLALEEAGWKVDWAKDWPNDRINYGDYKKSGRDTVEETIPGSKKKRVVESPDRYLGALAREASKEVASFREGIAEWERITGEDATALGCSCCGTPHSFSSNAGEYYTPEYPTHGARY
jgi:hypothetical protein